MKEYLHISCSRMVRKLVILSIMAFACVTSFAQVTIPQLDRAAGKRVSFAYEYSLSKDGGAFSKVTEGNVLAEDNAYRLDGLGLTIVCDGNTRWTYDPSAGEVVIESAEQDNILTNPALLISSYRGYGNALHVKGGSKDSLDVVYDVDEDVKARFVLTGIVYSDPEGKSDFTFDVKSLPKESVITDLR